MSNIDGGSSQRRGLFSTVERGGVQRSSPIGATEKAAPKAQSPSASNTILDAAVVVPKDQNHTPQMNHFGKVLTTSQNFLAQQSFSLQNSQPFQLASKENSPVSNNTIPLKANPTSPAENKPGMLVSSNKARFINVNLLAGVAQKLSNAVRISFLNAREHLTSFLKQFFIISGRKLGDGLLPLTGNLYLVGASAEEAGNVGAKVNTFLSSIASSVEDVASKAKISLTESSGVKVAQEMTQGLSTSAKNSFTSFVSKMATLMSEGAPKGMFKLAAQAYVALSMRASVVNNIDAAMSVGAQRQAGELEAKRRASLDDEEAAMSRLHVDEVTQAATVRGKTGHNSTDAREHNQPITHEDEGLVRLAA